jgi:O-Antigen ligase
MKYFYFCPLKFKTYIIPLLFFIALVLVYPLQWFRIAIQVPHYEILQLFTKTTLSMMAVAFCFIKFDRLCRFFHSKNHILILLLIFISITVYHFLVIPVYSIETFFAESIWWTIPLFAAVYHRELIRLLPWGFLFIWCFGLAVAIREVSGGYLLRGLPGNWNWQACMLGMLAPVIVVAVWRKNNRGRQLTSIIIFAVSGILFFMTELSTGAILSIVASLLIISLALCRHKLPPWLIPGVLAVIGGGIVMLAALYFCNMIDFPANGVRGCLWRGGFALIADSPVTGVGTASFTNAYKSYIPTEYYLLNFAAPRHNHPHNHFIYIWACFGIVGIIAWLGLLGMPIIRELRLCRRHPHWLPVSLLFGLLVVLSHAMIDLTLFVWPTNIIALLILGVFWGRMPRGNSTKLHLPGQIKVVAAAVSVFILVFTGFLLQREFKSSAACRNGMVYLDMKQPEAAYASFIGSMQVRPNKESAYRLARIAFYDFKQPDQALKYLGFLPRLGVDNYLHCNEMAGKIFFINGDYASARMYFFREVKNYPLAVRGWFYLMQAERKLGNVKAAEAANKTLQRVLKLKNLTPEFIPLLLTNEYWDLNPRMIPLKVLDKYNLKRPPK